MQSATGTPDTIYTERVNGRDVYWMDVGALCVAVTEEFAFNELTHGRAIVVAVKQERRA